MANETYISVRGYCAKAPMKHVFNEGNALVTLRVGVTANSWNRRANAYTDGETVWYDVRCYGTLGLNVADCVDRGTPLLIRGKLAQRTWTDSSDVLHQQLMIHADSVGIDLTNGTAKYVKVKRSQGQGEENLERGEMLRKIGSDEDTEGPGVSSQCLEENSLSEFNDSAFLSMNEARDV